MSDIDIKVAVLENRVSTIEVMQKETYKMVFDINSRLDKQNSLLPHMAEDIKNMALEIKSVSDTLATKTTDIAEALAIKTTEDAKNNTKLNILWGIIATLASAIIVGVIRFFSK